jgi:hypothetical protein
MWRDCEGIFGAQRCGIIFFVYTILQNSPPDIGCPTQGPASSVKSPKLCRQHLRRLPMASTGFPNLSDTILANIFTFFCGDEPALLPFQTTDRRGILRLVDARWATVLQSTSILWTDILFTSPPSLTLLPDDLLNDFYTCTTRSGNNLSILNLHSTSNAPPKFSTPAQTPSFHPITPIFFCAGAHAQAQAAHKKISAAHVTEQ